MSCSCTKQTFSAQTKKGLKVLLPLQPKRQTKKKNNIVFIYNSESNSHRKINDNRS